MAFFGLFKKKEEGLEKGTGRGVFIDTQFTYPRIPVEQIGIQTGINDKDIQIILSKLETINAKLENINRRLESLESYIYSQQRTVEKRTW